MQRKKHGEGQKPWHTKPSVLGQGSIATAGTHRLLQKQCKLPSPSAALPTLAREQLTDTAEQNRGETDGQINK